MKSLVALTYVFGLTLFVSSPASFAADKKEPVAASTTASNQKDKQVLPVPKGYHSLTPYLSIKGAAAAMDFYKRAFGAQELECLMVPDGKKIMHAEMKIGDSILMISDDFFDTPAPDPKAVKANICDLHLYVPDVDAVYDRAIKAGAISKMPVSDMFWGDRYGSLIDPFGLIWSISSHKEDLTKEEMTRRGEVYFKTVGKDIMEKIKNTQPLSNPAPPQ